MGWLKMILKAWSMKKKLLIIGLVVLVVAVATPILCINLLGPPGVEEGVDEIEVYAICTLVLTPEDIRDPQIALQHGILGYVELTWVDSPPPTMYPREVWSGTCLAHFVSHTCEVTEAELHIDLGVSPASAGTYYRREDGTEGFLNYSSLVRYSPKGIFTLRDGETLTIGVTVSADVPRSIRSFPLDFLDIWVDGSPYELPGVRLLSPDHHEVQVIEAPLPSDDP